VKRHFTATGFLVSGDTTILHWHKRLQEWMPPGGHIEPNEDPVTALLREILEETGLHAEVIPLTAPLPFESPGQLPAPYTILLEDIQDPHDPHQHIDLIYFCRPADGAPTEPPDPAFRWVDETALRAGRPLDIEGCDPQGARLGGLSVPIPEDVRRLALIAIETVRRLT
jgi:8-oxo-dGTP pyrophosphatase MutT (NUDIX family)